MDDKLSNKSKTGSNFLPKQKIGFLKELHSLNEEGWKFGLPATELVKAIQYWILKLPNIIRGRILKRHSEDLLDDFIQDVITEIWYVTKSKMEKDPTSLLWKETQWKEYIKTIIRSTTAESESYNQNAFSIPKAIALSVRRMNKIARILMPYFNDNENNLRISNEFEALVIMGCPSNGLCETKKCAFKACPLPMKRLRSEDSHALDYLIHSGSGSLTTNAKSYNTDYSKFAKAIFSIKDYKKEYLEEYKNFNVNFNLDNMVDFNMIKARLDKEFSYSIIEDQKMVNLSDIYLYDLSDKNINKLLETHEVEVPQRWLGKELLEIFKLSNSELLETLAKGDAVVNTIRKENGLKEIRRVIQTKSCTTHTAT